MDASTAGNPRRALVATLCIDVARSTATGLKMLPNQRFQFQRAIIDIVDRYLQALEFNEIYSTFGGDGWLLFAPDMRDWPALVILAKTLCHRYSEEVFESLSIKPEELPGIRTCICTGQDIQVSLFKQKDGTVPISWIGDSARRASRFASCPEEGELYVDQAIYDLTNLQFHLSPVNLAKLPKHRKPKRGEETRALWLVGDVKAKAVADADSPGPFIHYLTWTGRNDQGERLASEIHEEVSEEAALGGRDGGDKARAVIHRIHSLLAAAPSDETRASLIDLLSDLDSAPNVIFYNRRIDRAVDYPEARTWYDAMRSAGVAPDAFTFSMLINIAPDYDAAIGWYDAMRSAGIEPNAVTFNTLINIAPDYDSAVGWYDEMRSAGVPADEITFSTLINIASDYGAAVGWYDAMRLAGVKENAFTFCTLIKIAPDYDSAVGWYDRMRSAGVAPDAFTFGTLINIAPDYDAAVGWYDAMRSAGVAPNEVTFNTLIKVAPDYESAVGWYDAMRSGGVAPNEVTATTLAARAPTFLLAKALTERLRVDEAPLWSSYYSAVFSKVSGDDDPEEVIEWYFQQEFRDPRSLEPLIRIFRRNRRHASAMEIVVRWPQLPASGRFMGDWPELFLEAMPKFLENPAMAPTANYALGIFHFQRMERKPAVEAFVKALEFPTIEGRKRHIDAMLTTMQSWR